MICNSCRKFGNLTLHPLMPEVVDLLPTLWRPLLRRLHLLKPLFRTPGRCGSWQRARSVAQYEGTSAAPTLYVEKYSTRSAYQNVPDSRHIALKAFDLFASSTGAGPRPAPITHRCVEPNTPRGRMTVT